MVFKPIYMSKLMTNSWIRYQRIKEGKVGQVYNTRVNNTPHTREKSTHRVYRNDL